MRKTIFFLAFLFCAGLSACAIRSEPETPPQTIPMIAEPKPIPDTPVTVEPYEIEGPGTKELFYDPNWKFYVQDAEEFYGADAAPSSQYDALSEYGAAVLVCRELSTGHEWVLDELEYGSGHGYWGAVQLYPFTDILGRDGFLFEHPAGAAYTAYDFYEVNDTGSSLIAHCYNAMYTADLDGDGQRELMSNYHLMGYFDLFWTEGENNIVCSCSLNETARDYLGLIPGELVSLYIQEGDGEINARWNVTPDGASTKERTLDLVSLWKWEKARTEFWDVLLFDTDDGRDLSIRLRESRSRPEDYPLFDDRYRVEEIQVYDGNTLIQTISPKELSYDGGDHLFEGLFAVHGLDKVPGEPDIRDFNFDGRNDLGLMGSDAFPHNVPYCYFLWDPEAGRLSTEIFILFAPLEVDEANRRLIEPVSGDNPSRCYRFDASGRPVLVDPV